MGCISEDALPPVSITFARDPHISSNRQKNRHLRSNASLIEVSLSSALTPQPERCCIAHAYFHEHFIFVVLSVILLTIMCSSLENTCSLASLCYFIYFPRSSSWFFSIHEGIVVCRYCRTTQFRIQDGVGATAFFV